ncbi:tRNA-splicing endonuclease subunit Sen54 isoform X1 [Scomber scombrus]|uniref:tRNA-splicing endonuclease subunit Sen54 isoform X1 n=2 Tax=Scomber scombrus TaxID=13677 RepID=UPI002DDB81DE|nr:tRNA-splicing endonuclease subunit Sen54 isoform X1 [Scomber scombrus]
MADQNKKDTPGKFCCEMLSPSELFAARARSHKIPVKGQKDFFPNDSDEQRERLEQSLNEHWSLISEERVERLGSIVKASWIPSEQIVELQSPAGKFWQTMGFSDNGKQCLLPEEALYLMECGNLQVFYQDLPLSIQDGYERFLSSNTVSLQQYQVFGHLKRLGYVVHRFDPSSEPASYARQLNLPQSHDRAGRQVKRKRSTSPTPAPTSSQTDTQDASERMEEDQCSHDGEEAKKLPELHPTTSPGAAEAQTDATSSPDQSGVRNWWMTDVGRNSGNQADHHAASGSTRWDFSSILFPDLGSSERLSSRLASPDSSLLPGTLAVGDCDISPWRRRVNQREVKMSLKEREEDKHRRQWDVNRDREVRQCRNWAEYRDLLARREGKRKGQPAHLWNREVTPLHDPTQPISTGELLEKISVIKSTHLLDGASRLKGSDEWRICFNVYQPDMVADFKKSNPGKPYSRMCVCSFDGPVPDLHAIKLLAFQSGDVPVVFAVVDYGDISFYTFKDFQLPTDVFP